MTADGPTDLYLCVQQSDLAALETALDAWGFERYRLDGSEVTDQPSFMAQAAVSLPLPEGATLRGWDGFADHLWGGLYDVEAERVAILWTDAHVLLQHDLQSFLVAVESLAGVARQVASTAGGFSHPMRLHLFLVGEGPGFPPFPTP